MEKVVKLSLTTLLVYWVTLTYLDKSILNALLGFGWFWSILIFTLFLGFVALYCMSLQQCLELIKPENRKANPKSVWYMFLLPFNFVEDFFIVIDVSNSINEESKSNPKLASIKDSGVVLGIGWCIAQILSFIPNYVGQIAGLLSFILVLIHWKHIVKINQLLKN